MTSTSFVLAIHSHAIAVTAEMWPADIDVAMKIINASRWVLLSLWNVEQKCSCLNVVFEIFNGNLCICRTVVPILRSPVWVPWGHQFDVGSKTGNFKDLNHFEKRKVDNNGRLGKFSTRLEGLSQRAIRSQDAQCGIEGCGPHWGGLNLIEVFVWLRHGEGLGGLGGGARGLRNANLCDCNRVWEKFR